jgi:hypothetical protein
MRGTYGGIWRLPIAARRFLSAGPVAPPPAPAPSGSEAPSASEIDLSDPKWAAAVEEAKRRLREAEEELEEEEKSLEEVEKLLAGTEAPRSGPVDEEAEEAKRALAAALKEEREEEKLQRQQDDEDEKDMLALGKMLWMKRFIAKIRQRKRERIEMGNPYAFSPPPRKGEKGWHPNHRFWLPINVDDGSEGPVSLKWAFWTPTYLVTRGKGPFQVFTFHKEIDGEVWWCGVFLFKSSPSTRRLTGRWCGVVWCGVVWCGVVWCGVVWCGVVWCGVVWCGSVVNRTSFSDAQILPN